MKIKCAAILFYEKNSSYPIILSAKRHANILEKAFYLKIDWDREKSIQGFLTDNNTFVDRYEAAKIAFVNKQINKQVTVLYSEDVFPD